MSEYNFNEKVFDALFQEAVRDNFYLELEDLPNNKELNELYTFSPEHEARMRQLFLKERRKIKLTSFVKWSKKAVAIIAIIVSLFSGGLMTNASVRKAVYDTLIEWYDKYASFTSATSSEAEKTNIQPSYLPDGFIESSRLEMTEFTIIEYTLGELTITFQSSLANGLIAVNNENINYTTFIENEIEYHRFTATSDVAENIIVWTLDGQRYTVSSTLSIDELHKIAVSVN